MIDRKTFESNQIPSVLYHERKAIITVSHRTGSGIKSRLDLSIDRGSEEQTVTMKRSLVDLLSKVGHSPTFCPKQVTHRPFVQGRSLIDLFVQGRSLTDISVQGRSFADLFVQGRSLTDISVQGRSFTDLSCKVGHSPTFCAR